MPGDRHAEEVADERAAERQYAEAMRRRSYQPVRVQGPRNNLWTGTGVAKQPPAAFGQLVGRVALAGSEHEHLGGRSDFYIGDRHFELDGVEVFSWTARVACTFFRGTAHHPLCEQVAVVRTYSHSSSGIVEFYDEPLVDDPPALPFRRRALRVPAAPSRATLPPKRAPVQPPPVPSTASSPAPAGGTPPAEDPRHAPVELRAAELLQAKLAAPRGEQLMSVLSTLQPDQYDAVATPGRTSRIFEGQPGTGKTIIAAHRAAYLVSGAIDPQHRPDGSVLLIGPSKQYARHVGGLIAALAPERPGLRVISLPELLEQLTGQNEERVWGPPSYTWQDVDHELADFAAKAWNHIKRAGLPPYPTLRHAVEHVYDTVRSNGAGEPLTADPEWRAYLRRLPRFGDARDSRSLQPLLAYIRGRVQPRGDFRGVGHVIVDEAQDVHPLEWDILAEINPDGAWTILGDLNQRRSDHTEPSWAHVAGAIDILEAGKPPVMRLRRGYRSTRPIIQFANRLLPRGDRELASLQSDGPEPTVVATKTLSPEAVDQALALLARHHPGTVAIIHTEPQPVREELRSRGWVADRDDVSTWRKAGRKLTVIDPDHARGLEYDGVVVVEPGAFPPNLGRLGTLYTALTRANRELVIVHHAPLPEQIRVRRKRGE